MPNRRQVSRRGGGRNRSVVAAGAKILWRNRKTAWKVAQKVARGAQAVMRLRGGGQPSTPKYKTPPPMYSSRQRGGSVLPAAFQSGVSGPKRGYTTGSVGSGGNVVRKGRKQRRTRSNKTFNPKLCLKIGTESVNESRTTVSSGQCVYFGHGLSSGELKYSICRAITSRICMKAGLIIRDWFDPLSLQLGYSIRIEIQYYEGVEVGDAIKKGFIDIPITENWDDVALGLAALFTGMTSVQRPLAVKMYDVLPTVTFPVNSEFIYVHRCTMNFSDVMVHLDASSRLKFQNQTPAGTAESNRFETTDIGANPLVGMRYNNKKWSNGLIRKNRGYNEAVGSGFSLLPEQSTGFLASAITFPAPTGDYFKKPPPAREFDAKGDKVRMAPGEVGVSVFKFSCKISVLNLWSKWPELFAEIGGTTARLVPFGACELFSLEKTIDSGSEALISIGMQLDQKYRVYCTETRPPINRKVYVAA